MDLDNTITLTENGDYQNAKPIEDVIKRLHEYKSQGFEIVISSSRNMRTYEGNIGKINVNTLPVIMDWLNRHNVPYDEIYIGKPWCGHDGFYVDDRALRPDEFVNLSYDEIRKLTKMDGEYDSN
ncbi:WcnH [Bibersteinia trehalosi USDA-ARS-USMARC-189]|uniref:WcnH n=2 Tax=Bibersteinia trehalosi TaxID=47735 RepID=A0ABN4C5V2_BIBTR|nr:WcnH [Bibersteinia trehalosi USDA-ARS-USMARC-192]AHG84813.1 WcnH [Bibersteinia trehalosi USDA-ARS-USMARC-189]